MKSMNAQDKLLINILDCNLEELLEHDLYTQGLSVDIEYYLKLLINFLKADTNEVENYLQKIEKLLAADENNQWLKGIYYCSYIRFRLRKDNLDAKELEKLEDLKFPLPWNYEFHLVLGLAYLRLNLFEKSAGLFLTSYKNFSKYGCRKKALISYHNYIVSQVNLEPDKNYLAEFSFLVKLARREKVTAMEGGALVNLSRQYQTMGSLYPALKTVDEALTALSESTGTYHYYFALFQKCEILIDLGQNQEAFEVYQEAKFCPIKELKSSLEILERKMDPDKTLSGIQLPESVPWKERLNDLKIGAKRKRVGAMVQQLIAELERKPQDKYSLIERLYPENIDFEVKESRFKVLLSKVRRQYPGLVNKDGSLYKLEMADDWLKKKIS